MKHELKSKEPCTYFAKGECKFVGDRVCKFSHDMVEKRAEKSVARSVAPEEVVISPDVKAAFGPKPTAEALFVGAERLGRTLLRTVLQKRIPTLSSQSKNVLNYARLHGWDVREVEDMTIDHAFSHLCRERATLYVGRLALDGLSNTRTFSIFGVQRDKTLLEVKSDSLRDRMLSNAVTLGPRKYFPGDCTRVIDREDPVGVYDCVFAVDVYWNGDGPVTTATYKEWCLLSRTRMIYIITRIFRGAAGWDAEYVDYPDGVWFRDAQGMIVFSPDRGNFNYPKHMDVNFLEYKNVDGLSIRHKATFGPYCVFAVHLDGLDVTPVAVHLVPSENDLDYVVISKPTLWGRIGCCSLEPNGYDFWLYELFVRERRFLSYLPVMSDISLQNVIRAPTGYVFDGVVAKVSEALRNNVGIQELKRRYPSVYENIVRGTSFACLYKNRRAVAHDMLHVRQDHGDAETQLLLARNVNPQEQTRSWWWRTIAVLALVWLCSLFVVGLSRVPIAAAQSTIVEDPYTFAFGIFAIMSIFLYLYGTVRRQASLFEKWLDARTEQPGMEKLMTESGWQLVDPKLTVPPVEIQAMPVHDARGVLDIRIDNKKMTPQQAFDCVGNTRSGRNHIWPIVMSSGLMYAPAKTEANLIFAAYARIHCPIVSTATPQMLETTWKLASMFMLQLYQNAALEPPTLAECASVWTGAKAKVFLDTAEKIELGRHRPTVKQSVEYFTKKELNVKTNETIAEKGPSIIKPRSIVVLGVEHHVLHAPWARAVAKYMHTVLDGKWQTIKFFGLSPLDYRELHTRIWFGSGLTGAELSEIGRAIEAGDNVIAVAGDDIIMRIGTHVIEGDLSACDQSHSESCVRTCAGYYDHMGVPTDIVQDFIKSCAQPYVAAFQRVVIRGDPGYQLPTGSDWTTVDNTNAVLSMCLLIATTILLDPTTKPEIICANVANDMGFKLKAQMHDHVCHATFLKGLFLPDRDGKLCWFNLPSIVAKIGKIQKDPAQLGGLKQLSRAMALGMGAVPRDFPILGSAVAAMYRCGQHTTKIITAAEDGWYKATPTSNGIDRSMALEIVCRRYGISAMDIRRVEHLYDSITDVPAFVIDPVLNILTARDYE